MRIGLTLAVFLPLASLAQMRPSFEAADVRVSAPGEREGGGFLNDGRFEYRGATMLYLISAAYSVSADLIVGGPDWLATSRFDVIARASSRSATRAAVAQMLQTLLAERFGLAAETQQKSVPVYLLSPGKRLVKLPQSANPQAPDCPPVEGPPGLIHRDCHDFSMDDLARLLPEIARNYVDRPVVDATGMEGGYNFPLDWMSMPIYQAAKANPNGPPPVSLSDALDKLGLKLEPATRNMSVIAIVRVNPVPSTEPAAAAAKTEFEVAEVRPSAHPPARRGLSVLSGGQLEILDYSLRELMTVAFGVPATAIVGGPSWLDTERYDVIAKSPEVASPHAMSGMLQTLIVDRFKLQTHIENRSVLAMALFVGKGLKLKESDGTERSSCALSDAGKSRTYTCRNTTMGQLVDRLPNVAQAYLVQPLVDLTALTGAFDFALTWTPKNQFSRARPTDRASTPDGEITLFEAVDKQLGLKIEPRQHSLPVTVIDHAEKP